MTRYLDMSTGRIGSFIQVTDSDAGDNDELNAFNINKTQRNIYAGLQYHVGPLTWVAEMSLLHHTWDAGNTQAVNFVSLGASFGY